MKNNILTDFDIADYLDSKKAISEYLTQVLADGDTDELLRALGHIARTKGMTEIAKKTGLGRESLYKAFRPNAKPRFDTVMKVIDALKIQLSATSQLT